MAIAAALNILITSPSEQLKRDLKQQGLTVSQFARHLGEVTGRGANEAIAHIHRMTSSLGVALEQQLVSVKEAEQGYRLLTNALKYVEAGGESYAAMVRDAVSVEEKHADAAGKLLNRLAQLDAMFRSSKLSANAYAAELKAMTSVTRQATINFGPEVSRIKTRADAPTPEQDFARGRRALDRAWITGAISDTAKYRAELARLQKQLGDSNGVNQLNARVEQLRQTEERANAELLRTVQLEERLAKEAAAASLALQKQTAVADADARAFAEASAMNEKFVSGLDAMAVKLARLNQLRGNHGLSDSAYRQAHDEITGVAAARAEADARARERQAVAQERLNTRVAAANELNRRYASAQETLNQRQLELNSLRATGALTERAYAMAMKDAVVQFGKANSVMGKLGLTAHNLKSALGFFNPWLIGVAAAGVAVKAMADFERAMNRVAAEAAASQEELASLKSEASRMARVTTHSATDAAAAMSELAKAGFRTNQIMAMIRPTLRLATIGMLDTTHAATITARIMAGMRLPAEQLTDVVDSLAVAASASLTDIEELGEAMKFVGPVAAQAGLSLDDVMSSLMTLANAGLVGEVAGTGFRNMVLRLTKPTDEAAAAFQMLAARLGESSFALQTAEGKMLPMLQLLQKMDKAMKGMTDMEKLKVLNSIFRTRTTTIAAALISQGPDQFARMQQLQQQRQGIAEAMETQYTDDLWSDLRRLGNTFVSLAMEFEGLGTVIRSVINVFDWLMKFLIAGWQGVISALFMGVGYLAQFLGFVVKSLLSWVPGMGAVGEGLSAWADGLKDYAKERGQQALASGDAGAVSLLRAFGVDDTEAAREKLKTQLNTNNEDVAQVEESAAKLKLGVELYQKSEALQKEIVGLVEKEIEGKRKAVLELQLGNDVADEQLLLAQGLEAIERQKMEHLQHELPDAQGIAAAAEAALRASVDELSVQNKILAVEGKRTELKQSLAEAINDVAVAGMTDGEKALYNLGTDATDADRKAAEELDFAKQRLSVANAIIEAERERLQIQRQMANPTMDKFDEAYWKQFDLMNQDGVVTALEQAELDRLGVILEQTRALERQMTVEKQRRDELVRSAEEMKSTAEELVKKHNPIKAYQEEFVKLRTMLAAGLIDQNTFNKSRRDLQDQTLQSAGPKNIGYAAAIERGTAADYSASLPELKNPEYEELLKQTRLAERSQKTLDAINTGVADFNKGKALTIAP